MRSRKRLMKHQLPGSYQPMIKKDRGIDFHESEGYEVDCTMTNDESQECYEVTSKRSSVAQNEPDKTISPPKHRYPPVDLSEKDREVEAYLRDEIQEFNLGVICEDEETRYSDSTLERSNLSTSKRTFQSVKTESTVPNFSIDKSNTRPSIRNQSIEDKYINDVMRSILDVAISKAQFTNNETEIELVLEHNKDTESVHDETNFLQKALLNLSCAKQDSVSKPSVLARITVHVVPPRQQVPPNVCFKTSEGVTQNERYCAPANGEYLTGWIPPLTRQEETSRLGHHRPEGGYAETKHLGTNKQPQRQKENIPRQPSHKGSFIGPDKTTGTNNFVLKNQVLPPQSSRKEGPGLRYPLQQWPSHSRSGDEDTKAYYPRTNSTELPPPPPPKLKGVHPKQPLA